MAVKETPESLAVKLSNKLKAEAPDWHNLLKGFLTSSSFIEIMETLIKENENGKRFTPSLKDIFRAFSECKLKDLKVVIVGQDPYPQPLVADGIAFSCSRKKNPEMSLRYIFRAINKTVYDDLEEDYQNMSPDLKRWSNQGILLLNSALTTEIGKVSTHLKIWKPFINYLLDMLSSRNEEIIFLFLGKKAEEFDDLIDEKHTKFYTTHPASAAYQKLRFWECHDVFNRINVSLEEKKLTKILW